MPTTYQMPPWQNTNYWFHRQASEERYYQPIPKLNEFSKELETKVAEALRRVNLASQASMKGFIDELLKIFGDLWFKAGDDPIGRTLTMLIADAHGEIIRLSTSGYEISGVVKASADSAGNVIKFLRIIAPPAEAFSAPTFSNTSPHGFYRDWRSVTAEDLAQRLGLTYSAGLSMNLMVAGKRLVVIGAPVAILGSAVLWFYNVRDPRSREALYVTNKYIAPFNACIKKDPKNLENVKNRLIKEYGIDAVDVERLLYTYKMGREKALTWASKCGNFFDRTTEVLKILKLLQTQRKNSPYMVISPCCQQCYYQRQYLFFRQYLEIFKCLGEGKKWIKIYFPEGFTLTARLDYISPEMTTGFVRRQNVTVICEGKAIETKEQAQSCMNKLAQAKLPNGIILKLYLSYFDENYIGGNLVTSDLLALSEKVTSIECSAEPI